MNAAPIEPQNPAELPHPEEPSWSAGRWFSYITLAFALHIGLIYALSDRNPPQSRAVKNTAALRISPGQSELQQLDDPTLFALPHPRGFAGETWLRLPQVRFTGFRWTEPPRLLALPLEQLGAVFLRHTETNAPALREIALLAPPQTTVRSPIDPPSLPSASTLRLSGGLAGRKLRNAPAQLPLQPAQDGLTNTVVQVVVDERGFVISPTVFPPGSGSPTADQQALNIARTARFTTPPAAAKLTVGTLVFEWQTLPATNAPATPP